MKKYFKHARKITGITVKVARDKKITTINFTKLGYEASGLSPVQAHPCRYTPLN